MIIDGSSGNCDGCKFWSESHYQVGICNRQQQAGSKLWSERDIVTVASFGCSGFEGLQ